MRAFVRSNPRSLALASGNDVLLFRYFDNPVLRKDSAPKETESQEIKCIVELTTTSNVDMSKYQPLSQNDCYGCLGLINIDRDVFICTVTGSREVACPRPNERVHRIYGVEFYSLTRSEWDFVQLDANGYALSVDSSGRFRGQDSSDQDLSAIEHPCAQVRKLLSNGSFYYSTDFDLTSVMQTRGQETKDLSLDTIDDAFMWNSYMMEQLVKFRSRLQTEERRILDKAGFLTTAIRGFASTVSFQLTGGQKARMSLISRQACKRAGTRYNVRGVDDDGFVANFVETETILYIDRDRCFGYVQIRGSVPIFWEQDANLLSAKVNITRSLEATQPAFNKHFQYLNSKFGGVHCVNLLSGEKANERELSKRYVRHIVSNPSLKESLGYTNFDFHQEVAHGGYAMANKILPQLQESMIEFGFFSYDLRTGQSETEQVGVFRTNCLDCLDRTNVIQQVISKEALEIFLEYYRMEAGPDIWTRHNVLWADNGDQLSQIYAGTNALKTSFTRSGKMGLAGAIADVTKSVGRMYINNFVDKGRQNTIDVLLGRIAGQMVVALHDPINDFVNSQLKKREKEFTSERKIKIFAGTFNLNGEVVEVDLRPWLFPRKYSYKKDPEEQQQNRARPDDYGGSLPDIYLIGFQELVALTAGQILNADVSKKEFWERQVLDCLNSSGEEYVLLRSGQLVGTALMLFVKKKEILMVSKVEGATKKTGFGGMAGNKGGVAVSFLFANTSFCFITAHLAAGLHNLDERHQDFKTLSSGLQFSRSRKIKDHDSVIWLGDFNYRVTLPYDQTLHLIQSGNLEPLLDNEQLTQQMAKGVTFPYYQEMDITFPPTYKFDNGTNIYDTSDKQRTPSWTDRILSRGSNLRQISYGSAPFLFSDHRPVYGVFEAKVTLVDQEKKEKLGVQLYEKRRSEIGDTNDLVNVSDLNTTMLTHGLPPPSTDNKKWWMEGGQAAKVHIQPPRPGMVLNPNKGSPNPFSLTYESTPDFVDKPKLPPRPKTKPTVPRKPVRLSAEYASHSSTGNLGLPGSGHSSSSNINLPGHGSSAPPLPPRSRSQSIKSQAPSESSTSLLDDSIQDTGKWQTMTPTS